MKLNISNPTAGLQKVFEITDEKKLRHLWDKRLAQEIEGDLLGDEFKGYVFKITGGQDKDGFAMMQGVLANARVRLLLKVGGFAFQAHRGRQGERIRRSVRGCIVANDIAVLHLVVVKKGENDIADLTDSTAPLKLGPKRASKIRKLFNLSKEDDVRKFVIRKKVEKNGKTYYKSPKIQRLVTPARLQRKRVAAAQKKQRAATSKQALADYQNLLKRVAEQKRERHDALLKKRAEKKHAKLEAKRAVKTN